MPVDTLSPLPLPDAIASRRVADVNGLDMHVLEAGRPGGPVVLLLHGFPELAFSWRAVMPGLAAAGCHVIAPDQRGFGRTTGWDADYDGDLASFRSSNLVIDMLALLDRLGIDRVDMVVGHDAGSQIAGLLAVLRPDIFARAVIMSAPFTGPPGHGLLAVGSRAPAAALDAGLAALDPPRRHYFSYYSGRGADAEMRGCPQGLHAFLRAYFHVKSGDWTANSPAPLPGASPADFARLPTYYVLPRDADMAATVAPAMPSADEIAACAWLREADLAVYTAEYARTGFQGGLNWYRCFAPEHRADLRLFAGRTLDVPALFIAGARDWGIHQTPGAFAAMQRRACTAMAPPLLIPGAGHWVQQEAAAEVTTALIAFLGMPA